MNLVRLAWTFLWARPLVAALNLLMLALGFGAMVLVALVAEQLEYQAQRDLAGIDLVVGAKGSPLQLILSGVFHVDVPTGNIPMATVGQLLAQPLVAQAVPLSLGDGYKGFRIVGTTPDYVSLYGAGLQSGRLWGSPMEAVLGDGVARETQHGPGSRFAGAHGLGRDGDAHADRPFNVVGDLEHLRVPAELEERRSTLSVTDAEVAEVAVDLVATMLGDVRRLRQRSGERSERGAGWRSRVRRRGPR